MNSQPNIRNEAKQIFSEATEFLEQQERDRASVRPPGPGLTRQRAVLAGLVVSLPILISVVAINFTDRPLASLLETKPSPAIAREKATRTLDGLVAEVEAFRDDYDELPQSLVEVGLPSEGQWSYAVIADGRYSISGTLHGQAVRHESSRSAERAKKAEEVR